MFVKLFKLLYLNAGNGNIGSKQYKDVNFHILVLDSL